MATPNPPASTDAGEHLLTPGEVASLFRVDPKTVTRWARAVKLDLSGFANLAAFQKRVGGRKAVVEAMRAEGLIPDSKAA